MLKKNLFMILRIGVVAVIAAIVGVALGYATWPLTETARSERQRFIWMTQSLFLDKAQGPRSLKELLNRPSFQVKALDILVFNDAGPVFVSSQRVEGGFPIYPLDPLSVTFPGGFPEPNGGKVETEDIFFFCDSPCHFAVLVR